MASPRMARGPFESGGGTMAYDGHHTIERKPMSITFSAPASNPTADGLPRDRWGRPLITPPDGGEPVAYARASSYGKCLEDTFHLNAWSQRMVARGMAARPDLCVAVAAIKDPNDRFGKKDLNSLAQAALDAGNVDNRARIGTALHAMTEDIDAGSLDLAAVPERFRATLSAYREASKYWEVVETEVFVVNDDILVAGSADRFVRFTAESLAAYRSDTGSDLVYPDGEAVKAGDVVVWDLKSGSSVSFGAGGIAVQLGIYSHADAVYDHHTGARHPMPGGDRLSRKWGMICHAPVDGQHVDLVWTDVEAGWEAAKTLVPAVKEWRGRRDLQQPVIRVTADDPDTVSAPDPAAELRAAPTVEALRAVAVKHHGVWTPGLTSLAKEIMAAKGWS